MSRAGWKRAALAAALLVVAAVAILPFQDMPALATPLREALSRSLGRRVELDNVRCTLLPVPALLASNLVIADDPAFGLEPLAYADEVRASIRLSRLLLGSLELGEVRLVGASVNIARTEQSGFNLGAFLKQRLADGKPGEVPRFSLRQSRINFRTGPWKSVYYLNGVDLDAEPPRSAGGEFRWRYEASPARTDRAGQGFGRFTGSGRWMPGPPGGRFAVDVELEHSAVPELMQLVAGRDIGLEGRFTARAFLDGPLSALEVRGQIEVEDLERPAFFGLRSRNIEIPFRGLLNLVAQTLALNSAAPERGRTAAPLNLRLEGSGLLTSPRWSAEIGFDNLPAPALLDICRRLGLEAPAGVAVEGGVSGAARFATGAAANGELRFPSLQLRIGDAPAVEVADGLLRLDGDLLTLENARITTPKRSPATLRGEWNLSSGSLGFDAATEDMEIAELNGALAAFPALGKMPLAGSCTQGRWRGRLALSMEPGESPEQGRRRWSGRISLSDSRCQPEGWPEPLLLAKAQLELLGAGWRLRESEARFAGAAVRASAQFQPAGEPPLTAEISAERVTGAQLERLFRMAQPPPRGLFDRTLRRRAGMPAWLRRLDARGSMKVSMLLLGRQEFENVEAHFRWRAGHVSIDGLRANWKGAQVEAAARAALWQEEPEYSVRATVTGLETGGGTIDAELEAATTTLESGLERRTRGWAEASSPLLRLPSGASLRQVRASLSYDGERSRNPWRLGSVSFWVDGQFWSGRGEASAEGAARIWPGAQGARWEGALWPPALAPAAR
ncbi:MAG: hypothetical protein WHT08_16025 [Bryobacteraceae bacterium]